jgi:hypothetical protein
MRSSSNLRITRNLKLRVLLIDDIRALMLSQRIHIQICKERICKVPKVDSLGLIYLLQSVRSTGSCTSLCIDELFNTVGEVSPEIPKES